MRAMQKLRRPTYQSFVVLAVLTVALLVAFALGAEVASMAVGGGLVAAALAIVVGA